MRTQKTRLSSVRRQGGVALLEALISVLMLSLGVLALVGLQANMTAGASDAKYRAEASFLANQLVGLMWVDQTNLGNYAVSGGACTNTYTNCSTWVTSVARRLPNGGATVSIAGAVVTIDVTWQTSVSGAVHTQRLIANVVS